jgi:hypothetical protein
VRKGEPVFNVAVRHEKKAFITLGLVIVSMVIMPAEAQQAANCVVPTFSTADNQTVPATMNVRTGKGCVITMGVPVAGFADARIVQAPQRGTAAIRGYRVTYVPRKGYTGPDQFIYMRYNLDRWGNRSPRTVSMQVNVIP